MFPRRAVMRYLLKNSTSVDPKTKKKMQWLANAPFLAFFFIYLMLWNWSSDDPLWSQHICYFLKGVYAWLIDSEKMKSHQYLLHVSNRVKAGEATSVCCKLVLHNLKIGYGVQTEKSVMNFCLQDNIKKLLLFTCFAYVHLLYLWKEDIRSFLWLFL